MNLYETIIWLKEKEAGFFALPKKTYVFGHAETLEEAHQKAIDTITKREGRICFCCTTEANEIDIDERINEIGG